MKHETLIDEVYKLAVPNVALEDVVIKLQLREKQRARELRNEIRNYEKMISEPKESTHADEIDFTKLGEVPSADLSKTGDDKMLSCDWGNQHSGSVYIPPVGSVYSGMDPAKYYAGQMIRMFLEARPFMKHESLTAGQNLYLNILKEVESNEKRESESGQDDKPSLAHFTNPYIRKGMLTPNLDWEKKVKSGEFDRLYGVNSAELAASLPKLLDDCSLCWTRPFYCIDHFCLKVAIALRLKVLKRQDSVNKEFSHASIRRDAWADDHWKECEDCENCRLKADCADIYWDEC